VTNNLVTICVASPPTGSRAKLSKRFSKFFHILNFPKASQDTLTKIFTSILSEWIKKELISDMHDLGPRCVQAAIKV